jgi:hypothetical protein
VETLFTIAWNTQLGSGRCLSDVSTPVSTDIFLNRRLRGAVGIGSVERISKLISVNAQRWRAS